MASLSERTLGFGFGVLGGALIVLAAFVSLLIGAVDLATGRGIGAINAGAEAVLFFVVGGLALFFAFLGKHAWSGRPLVSGVLLLVIAAIGWGILGLGANVIALVGALFVFLAGVLFLIEPMKSGVSAVVTA